MFFSDLKFVIKDLTQSDHNILKGSKNKLLPALMINQYEL